MSRVAREHLLGYEVCAARPSACVQSIVEWVEHGDGFRWLACLNPHSYAVAKDRPAFAAALRDADWLVPDGVGVVLAARILGGSIGQRVTGFDVFDGVNRALDERGGGRVFFLGSTEETLAEIRVKMRETYPRVAVVGCYSPPFKPEYSDEEVAAMVAAINAAAPDVLWVGLTAPKQELWLRAVRGRLDVRFAAAIGAVFDFFSGRIRRSPPVFQRLGLEWLPRLAQEPRRLWRRTLVSAPLFLGDVVRARLGRWR